MLLLGVLNKQELDHLSHLSCALKLNEQFQIKMRQRGPVCMREWAIINFGMYIQGWYNPYRILSVVKTKLLSFTHYCRQRGRLE